LGITSSPAISGDLVVYGCKAGVLRALNVQTGKAIWTQRLGPAITAPPVISGSTVWIQSGITYALNLADGNILWRARLGNSLQSAPVVTEAAVYLTSMEGDVYALA
jgi:outer membrane protein assembly factor BamB